ncbi:MAG: hypothetical protein P8078_01175 [bacterium]
MSKYIIIFLCITILIIFVFYVLNELNRLPNDKISISAYDPPPPSEPIRPGIGDIIITGPERKPLLFSIDLSSNSDALDWQRLMSDDPTATITVHGYIDENGIFYIKNLDDAGHTNVGRIISKIMTTWRYTFYKIGDIQFYFNFPSKEAKLIIDISDLKRNPIIADYISIHNGMLYNILKLSTDLVNYGSIN